MKKIITVSLVAMMAVSAARAEIASVEYTTGLTGNLESLATTEKSNLTAAINEVAGKVGSESVASVKSELQDAIDAVDDKADANAGAINTINSGAVMNSGITSEKVAAYDAYAGQIADKEDVANKADAITDGMNKQASYPTVALMEKSISDANNDLGIEIAAANTAAADAQKDATQALADAAAANQAAADALTGAKAYTDQLANGAVKTNTEAISAINNADNGILAQAKSYADGKADAASGAAGEVAGDLAEYIQSNNDAVAGKADKATTLAGYGITDAMTSTQIGDAISTAKDEAVAAAKTAGDAAYDAKGAAAQALADAKADAEKYIDATELEQSQTAQNTALQNYADGKVQDLQGTLTSLATFPAACAEGTSDCALVIRSGTMQWEKVAY